MFLRSIKLANSVRVGKNEEVFVEDKRYDLWLDEPSGIILIRDKVHRDAHCITTMANVVYCDSEAFPHSVFDQEKQVKVHARAKGPKSGASEQLS